MRNTLIASLLFMTGCVTAQMTKERPDGGHVQVVGPGGAGPGGVAKAEALIAKKCPNGYQELERGHESDGARLGTGYGGSVDMTAFYIDFKCK